MTEAKAKYQYMDVARGLALLLVMISHAHGLSSFLIFYYIQIFFIISGYIYKPGRSYRDNIRQQGKTPSCSLFWLQCTAVVCVCPDPPGYGRDETVAVWHFLFEVLPVQKCNAHRECLSAGYCQRSDVVSDCIFCDLSAVLSDRRQVPCKCKDNGGHIGRARCRDDGIKRTTHSSSVEYGYCAGCGHCSCWWERGCADMSFLRENGIRCGF